MNKIIIKRPDDAYIDSWLKFAVSLKPYANKLVLVKGDVLIVPKKGSEGDLLQMIDDYGLESGREMRELMI